jgi:hypothetical protein
MRVRCGVFPFSGEERVRPRLCGARFGREEGKAATVLFSRAPPKKGTIIGRRMEGRHLHLPPSKDFVLSRPHDGRPRFVDPPRRRGLWFWWAALFLLGVAALPETVARRCERGSVGTILSVGRAGPAHPPLIFRFVRVGSAHFHFVPPPSSGGGRRPRRSDDDASGARRALTCAVLLRNPLEVEKPYQALSLATISALPAALRRPGPSPDARDK